YGPFATANGETARVPLDVEETAVQHAPGPARRLGDRAPRGDHAMTAVLLTKAWWAARIELASERAVARRWHATQTSAAHRRRHRIIEDADAADNADNPEATECGCRTAIRRGIADVDALLASPEL